MAKRFLSILMVLAIVVGLVVTTACNNETGSNGTVKVGFIFVGPKNDGGWTQAHYNGMNYLKDNISNVEVFYRESVPEQGPETKSAITGLIDQGCKIIFTTSYGFMDATLEIAKENPEIKFFHCSGYKTNDNMSTYFGKMQEPRYLSGIVAGMKTKSNKIGYVAAFEIPEVIAGIDAFTLGVQSVNKDAIVKVKWTHTWIDEAKEKEAAVALLDEGCDVITQHNDSTSPQIQAEERNAYAIGYDLDTPDAAPKAYMTAPIWNWGPYYVDQVQKVIDNKFKSTQYYEGMKSGTVDLAPLTAVAPEGANDKVEEVKAKILDGSFNVFTGPIYDQNGELKVKDGESLKDSDVLGLMWFVKGVEGKIETK